MSANRTSSIIEWISANRGKVALSILLAIFTAIIAPIVVEWITREPKDPKEPEEPKVSVLRVFTEPTEPSDLHYAEESIYLPVRVANQGTATAENCQVLIYEGSMNSENAPARSRPFGLVPKTTEWHYVRLTLPPFPHNFWTLTLGYAGHQVRARVKCDNATSPSLSDTITYYASG